MITSAQRAAWAATFQARCLVRTAAGIRQRRGGYSRRVCQVVTSAVREATLQTCCLVRTAASGRQQRDGYGQRACQHDHVSSEGCVSSDVSSPLLSKAAASIRQRRGGCSRRVCQVCHVSCVCSDASSLLLNEGCCPQQVAQHSGYAQRACRSISNTSAQKLRVLRRSSVLLNEGTGTLHDTGCRSC